VRTLSGVTAKIRRENKMRKRLVGNALKQKPNYNGFAGEYMASPNRGQRLRFAEFEICPSTGELRKNGLPLKLQPQPFRLLAYLVSRPGELVTREDIQQELWGQETKVEFDPGLNFCIRQIRLVLGDDAREPRFVETVPKRGYRFIAEVSSSETTPLSAEETRLSPEASVDELKPVLVSPDKQVAALPISSSGRWHRIALTTFLAVITFIAVGDLWQSRISKANSPSRPKAILISRFISIGLPKDDAWFSDALTQELIYTLAQTKTVKVTPWTAVLAIKNQPLSVQELRERFGVDSILEGSVTRVGDRLKIVTHLIDATSEGTLWSHEDQREAGDLAGSQDDITASLAEVLKLRLNESDVPKSRRRPEDRETYSLYLRAVNLADQFTDESIAKSIEYFNEVIRRAPDFARAYSGLALAQTIQPLKATSPRAAALMNAKAAAQKAIELDPTLGEAHSMLAHALFRDWQWKEAEKEFQKALQLDPDLASTHQLYGLYLATVGRHAEGIQESRRAVELAPASPLITYSLATVLFHAGNYEEAVVQCRRAQELSPYYPLAYLTLTRALTALGRTREALEVLDGWRRYSPEDVQTLWLANTLARSGQRERALKLLQQWRVNPQASRPPMAAAVALLAVGDREAALKSIHESVDGHVASINWLKTTPELAPLRGDPQFEAALAKMNLDSLN
jgi:DNA-binding winged helix-turn-helix (wHTH) protein/TolB-like protein/Flp pilus assembly protein TadD